MLIAERFPQSLQVNVLHAAASNPSESPNSQGALLPQQPFPLPSPLLHPFPTLVLSSPHAAKKPPWKLKPARGVTEWASAVRYDTMEEFNV